MKLNKVMLAAVMSLSVVSFAQAAGQGGGKVTFTGSIVDAPCSIHPDSLDQTVPMGAISNVALKNGGTSTPRDFNIQLEQCDFSDPLTAKNKVTTTFTGVGSSIGTDLLAINGTASGAGIAITTYDGTKIKFGTATQAVTLTGASPVLQYQAYLQGALDAVAPAVGTPIIPGDFTAVANFELAYQ